MYGPQLADAIRSLFPFDVEVDFDVDGDNDLVLTIQGATVDMGGTIIPNVHEYAVRGEITIPYESVVEAVDEDDARDKAEDAVQQYVDKINAPTGHGIESLAIFPADYTLNTVSPY